MIVDRKNREEYWNNRLKSEPIPKSIWDWDDYDCWEYDLKRGKREILFCIIALTVGMLLLSFL